MPDNPAPGSDPWQPRRVSQAAHFLLLLGATAAVFLAGVSHEGNLGAFLVMAGGAFLLCPPQVRVSWKLWAMAAALLLFASLALLPHGWFPEPNWRHLLVSEGVALPSSISPMPRETWFWLAILTIAVGAALFALSHPISSRTQLALASTGVAICGIYAGLSLVVSRTGWVFPLDPDPQEFGFFLNRNHTSAFLVTGGILALGILGVALRHRHWVAASLAAACLAVSAPSLIFFTISRGGILSLAVGTLLWLAGLGRRHWSKPLLISFGGVFLAAILLFLAPKSIVRQRIETLMGSVKNQEKRDGPLDPRILIFDDTLHLIRDNPLTGTGLGTFRYVFPSYRERALWDHPVLHPESDWLMLAAEAGIPALLTLFVGIGTLLCRAWTQREHPYWPLRWGILCAALAAFLHGFVDVPSHRTALGWWILVFAGMGLQTTPRAAVRPSRAGHLLFVLLGLGACGLGIQMVRAQWFGGHPSVPFAGYSAQTDIIGLRVDGKLAEAASAAREALKAYPLIDRLYFQLAVTLLRIDPKNNEADSLLRAQRAVSADLPQTPIDQGNLWLAIDPSRTAAAWLEGIRRRHLLDQSQHFGDSAVVALYRDFLGQAAPFPEVQKQLLAASTHGPAFTLAWLEQALPELAAAEFPHSAGSILTGPDRRRFLQLWYARGNREALFEWLASQPDWSRAAWPIAVHRLTDAGKFEEAVHKAAAQFDISLELPTSSSESPPIADVGAASAFSTYWRKGNFVSARRILEEARAKPHPTDPEVWRLSAALCVREGQWQTAWQYVERYLREAHPDPSP